MIEIVTAVIGTKKIILVPIATSIFAVAFTPDNIIALVGSATALVIAIGAIIVNIMKERTASIERKAQGEKIEATLISAKVTEGHVNSEKTRDAGEIITLKRENELLRSLMINKDKDAALLAQAAAIATAQATTTIVTKPVESEIVKDNSNLEKIESNTASIDKNTKKTAVDVTNLKKENKK